MKLYLKKWQRLEMTVDLDEASLEFVLKTNGEK